MKNEKRMIIVSIILTLLIIILLAFFKNNKLYIHDDKIENEEIEQIALVYRNENYSYGHTDNVYIFDEDGTVYYEDFVNNANLYQDFEYDLMKKLLTVYENKDKIIYQFDEITNSFKEQLYKTNYNWSVFNKQGVIIDGGEQTYYALLKIGTEYELIKLMQNGSYGEIPWSGDYYDICNYMDGIRTQIRQQNEN